jgi:hypothetical protein
MSSHGIDYVHLYIFVILCFCGSFMNVFITFFSICIIISFQVLLIIYFLPLYELFGLLKIKNNF